jgi:hypothetical protein
MPHGIPLATPRMPTCILHVGMPKTGTTSIQESLFHGLEDPRFRLISLGHSNAVLFLEPLFGDDPERFWVHRRSGCSAEGVRRRARDCDRRLRAALRKTHAAGATAIISAERCWAFSEASLERFRDYVAREGFDVRVIAYLRPHASWFESSCSQEAKLLNHVFDLDRFADDVRVRPGFWYPQRLAALERVFGRDNLTVRSFSPGALADGCAVRDFCTVLGIDFDHARVVRANESISADAVRMLHCFHRHHPDAGRLSLWSNYLLVKRLEQLDGDPLRFHATVLEPLAGDIARQVREIVERYGVDLRQESLDRDGARCVRDEADMQRFSRGSLDWLARVSGRSPVVDCQGEATALRVAEQVAAIARRPALGLRLDFLRYRLRRALRSIRHGD